MHEFIATGSIYPLEIPVSIDRRSVVLNVDDTRLRIEISANSNVALLFVVTEKAWHPEDLLNICESFVQHLLDVIAFVYTRAVEVYVHTLRNKHTGEEYRRVSITNPLIPTKFGGEELQHAFEIQRVFGNSHGYQIMRALDDFRLALRRAEDTGFFCFRALECLRVYCRQRYGLGENRSAQWAKVRELSGASESETKWIGQYGTAGRHADFKPVSGDERQRLLDVTRKIIDSFLRAEFSK